MSTCSLVSVSGGSVSDQPSVTDKSDGALGGSVPRASRVCQDRLVTAIHVILHFIMLRTLHRYCIFCLAVLSYVCCDRCKQGVENDKREA